ncbi:MAG: pyruvate kinase [Planctomycetota bacterium]
MTQNLTLPLKDSRTKTVATVGPASSSIDMLKQLLSAGVDVFRINMAHGAREDHDVVVTNIRAASEELGLPAGILVDLAGPKIRLGQLTQNPLVIANDQRVRFIRGTESHSDDELTCIYEPLIDEVGIGEHIVLADGLARLVVTDKTNDELICRVIDGGAIRSRQGVNLPGTKLSVPALGDIDKQNAAWAAQRKVDFVSLSFVRNADEVQQLKNLLADERSHALVVSKIEKKEALDHLDSIVATTDAVMVARGDLGVEIPIEQTPGQQKRIIKMCLKHRKPVIVATQMLESMHSSKQPTRAEVTDVANAILDGADACMLSGETAIGSYPVDAVKMMNRIMTETEKALESRHSKVTAYSGATGWEVDDAVIYGSSQIAKRISAKMVVLASSESKAALRKSKQRDYIPTLGVTDRLQTYRRMTLFWGVIPVLCTNAIEETRLSQFVSEWIKEKTSLVAGDRFVMVTDNEVLPGVHDSVMVSEVK